MKGLSTELKVGMAALLVTLASSLVLTIMWYEDHRVSREFVEEVQRLSAASPVTVTEGELADWTRDIRKTETAKGEMEKHFVEQINKIRNHEYSEQEFYQHVANCKRFCGQLIDKMIAASTEEISKFPHDVVFFDLNKDTVSPAFQKKIRDFVGRNKNQSIFIVGRASRIGALTYNKELSGRRVKSVTRILRRGGLPEDRIKSMWIGFEAPQLTRTLAELYKIDPNEYKGDLFQLNQSVVLCTSPTGVFFPTILSSMEEQVKQKRTPPSKESGKQRG